MKSNSRYKDLPELRPPHPGELIADVLADRNLTQQEFADMLGIARHRLNAIIHGRRSITADTALRLAKATDTSATVWMREQAQCDLWDALHGATGKSLAKVRALTRVA